MTTNAARAAALIEAMIEHDVEILAADPADTGDRTHGPGAIVQALAKTGLLAPVPRVIRTREELAALDPDALVVTDLAFTHGWESRGQKYVYRAADAHRLDLAWQGPVVVITPGEQVRAARQALEEA